MRRLAFLPLVVLLALPLSATPAMAQESRPAQELADEARKAAREDRNEESARLFRRAIETDRAIRGSVLREYADQLVYSGRAAQAVPLLREYLRSPASEQERRRAERALALALQWSGQTEQAIAAWERVLANDRLDSDARKNLRDALVSTARRAASEDRNAEAAALFARAMQVDPPRRRELMREYADQLTYSGRPAEAVPLYRRILWDRNDEEERRGAHRGLALALQWSKQTDEAIAAWQQILDANPSDVEARKNLRETLLGAARKAARDDRNAEAAAYYARAIEVDPARRQEILREYADQLTYSGRAREATPLYREVLASPTLDRRARLEAMLGLGLALSWTNQLDEALATYDQALREAPDSPQAHKGRGRVLGWMGRQNDSLEAFERALALAPDDAEALRGAAQAETHLGRHRDSLARLSPLLARNDDPAALAIAARASYYMGRPDTARNHAQRTLALQPGNITAHETIADLERDRRPYVSIAGTRSTQNNGLEIISTNIRYSMDIDDGLTTIGAHHRLSDFDSDEDPDVRINGAGFFVRHRFGDALEANGSLLINRITGAGHRRVEPTWDAWLTFWPSDYFRLDLSASRGYFDDARSIARNVWMDAYGLAVDFTPYHAFKFSVRGSYGWISDGNERLFAQAETETRLAADPEWYIGARYTHFDFAMPQLDHGYFNPDWLHSVEATMRLKTRFATYWSISAGGSLGYEWQPDERKPIWTATLAAVFEPSPDVTLTIEARHQDMSTTGGSEGFRRTTFGGGLTVRW